MSAPASHNDRRNRVFWSQDEAFRVLCEAKQAGRRIVPLVGAGISIAAGVPLTGQIRSYLEELVLLVDEKLRRGSFPEPELGEAEAHREYVRFHGWVDRHQVHRELELLLGTRAIEEDNPPSRGQLLKDVHERMLRSVVLLDLQRMAADHPYASAYFLAQLYPKASHAAEVRPTLPWDRIVTRGANSGVGSTSGNLGRPDWLDAICHFALNDNYVLDSLFDRLVRYRQPSLSHQYLALLTRLLGWRLLFTTNFDGLIEMALRDQGLEPVSYEIMTGAVPNADLISSNLSIVKLHGGAFNLRADRTLDLPADDTTVRMFCQCLKNDPILVVAGYSGGDERVRSLLREHILRSKAEDTAVLWVHRGDWVTPEIREIARRHPGRLAIVPYSDAGLFFQELYLRIARSHPNSNTPYRALTHVPPTVVHVETVSGMLDELVWRMEANKAGDVTAREAREEKEDKDYRRTPVVLFEATELGVGTSSNLSAYVLQQTSYQAIWIDLEEINSADAFASALMTEFRRFDPDLTPAVLTSKAFERSEFSSREGTLADPRMKQILEAMRRGRYLIALDSFTSGLPEPKAQELHPESQSDDRDGLLRFLLGLINHHKYFGNSRLCAAVTSDSNNSNSVDLTRQEIIRELLDKYKEEQAKYERVPRNGNLELLPVPVRVEEVARVTNGSPPFILKEALERTFRWSACDLQEDLDDVDKVINAIACHWECPCSSDNSTYVDPAHVAALLAICGTFRRPRSWVAIHRLLDQLGERSAADDRLRQFPCPTGLWPMVPDTATENQEVKQAIEQSLAALQDCKLIYRQEGGSYWMPRTVRLSVYKRFSERYGTLASQLHDEIARYYYDEVYLKSRDVAAFFEYVFHRIRAVELTDDPKEKETWKKTLGNTLMRERHDLLWQGHAATLLQWTKIIEGKFRAEDDSLLKRVIHDLEFDIYRELTSFNYCLSVKIDNLESSLRKLRGVVTPEIQIKAVGYLRKMIALQPKTLEHNALDEVCRLQEALEPLPADKALMPILEDLLEIGICLTGKRLAPQAIAVLELVRKVAAKKLPVDQPAVPNRSPEQSESEEDRLIRLLVQSTYRRLHVAHSLLGPWDQEWGETQIDDKVLKELRRWFTEAQQKLQQYTTREHNNYARYKCHLNSHWARCLLLAGSSHQDEARRRLEEARSWVERIAGGAERTATGVCDLYLGEMEMQSARRKLSGYAHSMTTDIELAKIRTETRENLDRAKKNLASAQMLIGAGRTSVWWWVAVYLMRTQLEHERLLRFLVLELAPSIASGRPGQPGPRDWFLLQRWIYNGLWWLRGGLENIGNDEIRRAQFHELWLRLFVCTVLVRERIAGYPLELTDEEREQVELETETRPLAPEKVEELLTTKQREFVKKRWKEWNYAIGLEDYHVEQKRRDLLELFPPAGWERKPWTAAEVLELEQEFLKEVAKSDVKSK